MSPADRPDLGPGPGPGAATAAGTYGVDVLAFGPHPDDVELFCGGTVIRLGELGHSTAVCDLTRGERASHGTPEERIRELSAAIATLRRCTALVAGKRLLDREGPIRHGYPFGQLTLGL